MIYDLCVCSPRHPVPWHRESHRRVTIERAKGVLWRHASINLESRNPSHEVRREFPRWKPGTVNAVSTGW